MRELDVHRASAEPVAVSLRAAPRSADLTAGLAELHPPEPAQPSYELHHVWPLSCLAGGPHQVTKLMFI